MTSNSARIKVTLLGNAAVGKTSLLMKWTGECSKSVITPTVLGVEKQISYGHNEDSYQVTMWDTAGQEMYKSLTVLCLRDVSLLLLVFDLTDRTTLDGLQNTWIPIVHDKLGADVPTIIVANKKDLVNERKVSTEEGHDFASRWNAGYMEVSALTGAGVDDALDVVCARAIESATGIKIGAHLDLTGDTEAGTRCC